MDVRACKGHVTARAADVCVAAPVLSRACVLVVRVFRQADEGRAFKRARTDDGGSEEGTESDEDSADRDDEGGEPQGCLLA
jgi:hypothetical protein